MLHSKIRREKERESGKDKPYVTCAELYVYYIMFGLCVHTNLCLFALGGAAASAAASAMGKVIGSTGFFGRWILSVMLFGILHFFLN